MSATGEHLTPKQEAFVCEYLTNGRNGAAAYRTVYGGACSDQTAAEEACKLLKHPKVAPRVEAVIEVAAMKTEITVARVLEEVALVAFSDVTSYEADDTGRLVLRAGATPSAARAVSSHKRKITRRLGKGGEDAPTLEDVEVEFRLWPKVEALKLLMQHLGMLKQLNEHSGPNGGPIPVEAAAQNCRDHWTTEELEQARELYRRAAERAALAAERAALAAGPAAAAGSGGDAAGRAEAVALRPPGVANP